MAEHLPPIPARYRAKTSKKCKSCQACRNNPKLKERYYKAWFDRTPGEETLEMIGKELGISNQAIYRHAHNHMKRRVSKMTAVERRDREAGILKAETMKSLEVSFDHGVVVPKDDYETLIDTVIAEGMAELKVGETRPTINQMLAAAKLKGEWKLKKRGQDTELIKMMYRSASGFTPEPSDRTSSEPSVVGGPGPN